MYIDYFVNNDEMVMHYNLHFYDLDHDTPLEYVVFLQNFSVNKYLLKKYLYILNKQIYIII